MVVVPYALTYKTTLRGHTPKSVCCDGCNFEYVYLLQGTVVGEGISLLFLDNAGARQRSAERAEAALHESLAGGCEVVPCPRCGMVQRDMLPRARELHLLWMRKAGLTALTIGGILSLPVGMYAFVDLIGAGFTLLTAIALLVVGAFLGVGMTLIAQRRRLCGRYDPNGLPVEDRKRMGQRLAISKEDFMKFESPPSAEPGEAAKRSHS